MCLRLLQKHGHRPIVLLGGGTTRIGDPSGKDKTRKILEEKEIEKNIKSIEIILKKFLDTEDKKIKPIFVNNYSWLKNLNYISFLRDIGKHFTINKMLSFDSIKLRLEREQSLSYMEFNYMILQAYDFLELNKKENCVLQIGGSDQWGNIVNGVDLIKRYLSKEVYGLTTPLITLASGAKMGSRKAGTPDCRIIYCPGERVGQGRAARGGNHRISAGTQDKTITPWCVFRSWSSAQNRRPAAGINRSLQTIYRSKSKKYRTLLEPCQYEDLSV